MLVTYTNGTPVRLEGGAEESRKGCASSEG